MVAPEAVVVAADMVALAAAQVAVDTAEAVRVEAERAAVAMVEPVVQADTAVRVGPVDVAVLDRDTHRLTPFTTIPMLSRGISFLSFRKAPRPTNKCYLRLPKGLVDS